MFFLTKNKRGKMPNSNQEYEYVIIVDSTGTKNVKELRRLLGKTLGYKDYNPQITLLGPSAKNMENALRKYIASNDGQLLHSFPKKNITSFAHYLLPKPTLQNSSKSHFVIVIVTSLENSTSVSATVKSLAHQFLGLEFIIHLLPTNHP